VWLAALLVGTAAGVAGIVYEGETIGLSVGLLVVAAVVLAVPALPPLLPDSVVESPVSRRRSAVVAVAVAGLLVAAPAVPAGLVVVDDTGVEGSESVEVRDYDVAYGENVTSERTTLVDIGNDTEAVNASGVVVASADREIWTLGAREEGLAFSGNETVVVGGLGWRETVEADRTGWEVVGNDSAYAVDLTHDGETTRSYRSSPSRADVRVDGREFAVAPTTDGFEVRVLQNGSVAGSAPVPATNESATAGGVVLENRVVDETERVVVVADDTEVQVAERETYD
jgi:hypothetical protein